MPEQDKTPMATPSLPPPDANDRIDIDIGDMPSADPTLPAWVATLITAIGAIVAAVAPDAAFETLRALLAPYQTGGAMRARMEGLAPHHKASLLAAKDRKLAEIRAADAAARAASTMAATERQAIPVASAPELRGADEGNTAAPAMELRAPMVHPGRWTPLMQDGRRYRQASSAERARRVECDVWGARIEHAPTAGVGVGSLVRLHSQRNNRSSVHVIIDVVVTDGLTTIAVVRAATDADQAPRLVPVLATGSTPITAGRMPPQVYECGRDNCPGTTGTSHRADMCPGLNEATLANPLAGLAADLATVENALTSAAIEGASNATAERSPEIVQPTTRGNGETATDSGASIGIFGLPRAQRAFVVGTQPREGSRATVAERTRLLTERALIAGSVAANGWLQVSWTGEGSTLHGKVNDALIAIEREQTDMPPVPTGENYAGEAVSEMRSRDYDTKRLPKRDCPEGVDARWIIGRALQAGGVARAGDAYGTTLLIVDLLADGTLAFDGDMSLANAVRTKYATKVAKTTLNSKQLTPWLGQTLRRRHGAVKRGHCWYVPPGQAKAVRALIGGQEYANAVEAWAVSGGEGPLPKFEPGSIGTLWGDHELMSVNTGADLLSSLSSGLRTEVQRIADALVEATELAKTRARDAARKKAADIRGATEAYITAEGEAAFKRATVSGVVAARMLKDLGTAAARLSGYSTVLGDDATTGVTEAINALRSQLEPLTDDTSIRGAMLELE